MTTTVEHITHEALQLPPRQRVALAGFLLDLDDASGDPGADEAWEQEIQARIGAIDSGVVIGIPCHTVMREAEKRLAP